MDNWILPFSLQNGESFHGYNILLIIAIAFLTAMLTLIIMGIYLDDHFGTKKFLYTIIGIKVSEEDNQKKKKPTNNNTGPNHHQHTSSFSLLQEVTKDEQLFSNLLTKVADPSKKNPALYPSKYDTNNLLFNSQHSLSSLLDYTVDDFSAPFPSSSSSSSVSSLSRSSTGMGIRGTPKKTICRRFARWILRNPLYSTSSSSYDTDDQSNPNSDNDDNINDNNNNNKHYPSAVHSKGTHQPHPSFAIQRHNNNNNNNNNNRPKNRIIVPNHKHKSSDDTQTSSVVDITTLSLSALMYRDRKYSDLDEEDDDNNNNSNNNKDDRSSSVTTTTPSNKSLPFPSSSSLGTNDTTFLSYRLQESFSTIPFMQRLYEAALLTKELNDNHSELQNNEILNKFDTYPRLGFYMQLPSTTLIHKYVSSITTMKNNNVKTNSDETTASSSSSILSQLSATDQNNLNEELNKNSYVSELFILRKDESILRACWTHLANREENITHERPSLPPLLCRSHPAYYTETPEMQQNTYYSVKKKEETKQLFHEDYTEFFRNPFSWNQERSALGTSSSTTLSKSAKGSSSNVSSSLNPYIISIPRSVIMSIFEILLRQNTVIDKNMEELLINEDECNNLQFKAYLVSEGDGIHDRIIVEFAAIPFPTDTDNENDDEENIHESSNLTVIGHGNGGSSSSSLLSSLTSTTTASSIIVLPAYHPLMHLQSLLAALPLIYSNPSSTTTSSSTDSTVQTNYGIVTNLQPASLLYDIWGGVSYPYGFDHTLPLSIFSSTSTNGSTLSDSSNDNIQQIASIVMHHKKEGDIAMTEKNTTVALAHYTRAINLCPRGVENQLAMLYALRATAHTRAYNWNNVVTDVRLALFLGVNHVILRRECFILLGKAYQMLSCPQQALDSFDMALALGASEHDFDRGGDNTALHSLQYSVYMMRERLRSLQAVKVQTTPPVSAAVSNDTPLPPSSNGSNNTHAPVVLSIPQPSLLWLQTRSSNLDTGASNTSAIPAKGSYTNNAGPLTGSQWHSATMVARPSSFGNGIVSTSNSTRMFVFGGWRVNQGPSSDLYVCDIVTRTWVLLRSLPTIPPGPLYGHSASLLFNRYIVFLGGRGSTEAVSIMRRPWVFDTVALSWFRVDTLPSKENTPNENTVVPKASLSSYVEQPKYPPLRFAHAAIAVNDSTIYIHGGIGAMLCGVTPSLDKANADGKKETSSNTSSVSSNGSDNNNDCYRVFIPTSLADCTGCALDDTWSLHATLQATSPSLITNNNSSSNKGLFTSEKLILQWQREGTGLLSKAIIEGSSLTKNNGTNHSSTINGSSSTEITDSNSVLVARTAAASTLGISTNPPPARYGHTIVYYDPKVHGSIATTLLSTVKNSTNGGTNEENSTNPLLQKTANLAFANHTTGGVTGAGLFGETILCSPGPKLIICGGRDVPLPLPILPHVPSSSSSSPSAGVTTSTDNNTNSTATVSNDTLGPLGILQSLTDVKVYDINTKTWLQPLVLGSAPRGAVFHTAIMVKHWLFVLGGFCSETVNTLLEECKYYTSLHTDNTNNNNGNNNSFHPSSLARSLVPPPMGLYILDLHTLHWTEPLMNNTITTNPVTNALVNSLPSICFGHTTLPLFFPSNLNNKVGNSSTNGIPLSILSRLIMHGGISLSRTVPITHAALADRNNNNNTNTVTSYIPTLQMSTHELDLNEITNVSPTATPLSSVKDTNTLSSGTTAPLTVAEAMFGSSSNTTNGNMNPSVNQSYGTNSNGSTKAAIRLAQLRNERNRKQQQQLLQQTSTNNVLGADENNNTVDLSWIDEMEKEEAAEREKDRLEKEQKKAKAARKREKEKERKDKEKALVLSSTKDKVTGSKKGSATANTITATVTETMNPSSEEDDANDSDSSQVNSNTLNTLVPDSTNDSRSRSSTNSANSQQNKVVGKVQSSSLTVHGTTPNIPKEIENDEFIVVTNGKTIQKIPATITTTPTNSSVSRSTPIKIVATNTPTNTVVSETSVKGLSSNNGKKNNGQRNDKFTSPINPLLYTKGSGKDVSFKVSKNDSPVIIRKEEDIVENTVVSTGDFTTGIPSDLNDLTDLTSLKNVSLSLGLNSKNNNSGSSGKSNDNDESNHSNGYEEDDIDRLLRQALELGPLDNTLPSNNDNDTVGFGFGSSTLLSSSSPFSSSLFPVMDSSSRSQSHNNNSSNNSNSSSLFPSLSSSLSSSSSSPWLNPSKNTNNTIQPEVDSSLSSTDIFSSSFNSLFSLPNLFNTPTDSTNHSTNVFTPNTSFYPTSNNHNNSTVKNNGGTSSVFQAMMKEGNFRENNSLFYSNNNNNYGKNNNSYGPNTNGTTNNSGVSYPPSGTGSITSLESLLRNNFNSFSSTNEPQRWNTASNLYPLPSLSSSSQMMNSPPLPSSNNGPIHSSLPFSATQNNTNLHHNVPMINRNGPGIGISSMTTSSTIKRRTMNNNSNNNNSYHY